MSIFLRRFFRRLRHAFRFNEMLNWEYESCDRCGCFYRITTMWSDSLWLAVNGTDNNCLCPTCLITLAEKKKLIIRTSDIESMMVFDPYGIIGGSIELGVKEAPKNSND